ncbi:MAG: hypothetical protein A2233_00240 [Candidatus Kerfeldbacteria bacterium RIFOXYA2_FULL_38_24]|nr:MAG: hypothetical protein A2233_00240 [Candidatus Kerfeldbacteria bacterium RIFOXYA2_FULL_38_24]
MKEFQSANHFSRFRRSQNDLKAPLQPVPGSFWRWLKKDGWAYGGLLLMLGCAIWYFGFGTKHFDLSQIEVAPLQFIDQQQIINSVQEFESSKFLGFIKRDTFWTMKTISLQAFLKNSLSHTIAFEEVNVKKIFPNIISITIKERIPSVTWITAKAEEKVYTVDRDGVVTQSLNNKNEANTAFPVIIDKNRDKFEIGWQIISPKYLEYLLQIQKEFSGATSLKIDHFIFPLVGCSERQYVAEKIFEKAASETNSEEYKAKQREIQEKFQNGLITIDESLEALDNLKKEEFQNSQNKNNANVNTNENTNIDTNAKQTEYDRTEWAKVYVPIECNFVKVAHEIHLQVVEENGGFEVYLDTLQDLSLQLQNLKTILAEKISDPKSIDYIDVRIPDRAYFK